MNQPIGLDERTGLRRRLLLKVLHSYFAMSRGMTLGVRAACFNTQGEIFLVGVGRHAAVIVGVRMGVLPAVLVVVGMFIVAHNCQSPL